MSSKKLNIVLYAICCILALYGLIILIRKMMLASDGERKSKKELGMKFYIEPFRQTYISRRSGPTYSSVKECIESETQRYKEIGSLSSDTLSHINSVCSPGGILGVPDVSVEILGVPISQEHIIQPKNKKSREQRLSECLETEKKTCDKKFIPGCLELVDKTCNMLYGLKN